MKKILIIITGSIAAYKVLDVIRLLRKNNYGVSCVMTNAAKEFVTPLSVSSIAGSQVYSDVFSLKDEAAMGHIRLSREADLVLVAPASADIIAKMANGLANDLASTILLATDKQVMVAPAMNIKMWNNKAVQRNVKLITEDGAIVIGPALGELACGEIGEGRLLEPEEIFTAVEKWLKNN